MSDEASKQAFIFVTGASRSGTTMLSRVLGNADAVLPLNELHFFGGLVPVEESSTPMASERASKVVAMTLARVARDVWVKEPTDQEWMSARRIVAELADEEVTGVFRENLEETRSKLDPVEGQDTEEILETWANDAGADTTD